MGFVDYANNMIHAGPHALATEDAVVYTNRFGTSIGGLVNGLSYYVVAMEDDPSTPGRDESHWIRLAATETQAIRAGMGFLDGNVVDLQDRGGLLATALNERAFDGADVDAAADSIVLRNAANGNFNKFELGQAVVYRKGTAPIAGLIDGATYYIIVATSENNLQGDTRFATAQVVQLAESENEARAGVAIDIGPSTGTGYTLAAKHVLDSGFSTGIGIAASLTAEDKASASAGLESEEKNPSKWAKFNETLETNVADSLFSKLTGSYAEHAGKANAGSSNSLSVAGALAFTFANHTVRTDVGAATVLRSNEDLEILANLEQRFQINSESTFEPQENDQGKSAGTSAENAASVAVNVGIFNNTAEATVHGGAKLDALRTTRVVAGVLYPFLTRPDTYVPTSAGELVDSMRTEGTEAVTKYLNDTLGLKDSFFNSWAASTAESDQLSIAGSVNVLVLTNEAAATVRSGAEINQDADWRDNAKNPHPNQAAQQADGLGEQVVTVMATNYMQTINMTGIFSLPELEIDPSDIGKSKLELPSAFGSEGGGRGGMGGAFYVTVQQNTTHAIVEDGAKVYSGGDGGFHISAGQAVFAINLTQAGASAGKLAIGGSVAYVGVTNDTLARLGSTAVVTGRDVRVTASDFECQINWVGGVAKGENVGVGIAVAINNFHRDTRAVIGDPETLLSSGGPIAPATFIDVTGGVSVHSVIDGELWAFTVAGAAVTGSEPDKGSQGSAFNDDDPLDGKSLPALFNEDVAPEASQQKTGIGIAAAVAINLVKDNTQASIVDAGRIEAGDDVSIVAASRLAHVAATGGAAFAKSGAGGQSTNALAGALSFNNLDITTQALLVDTEVACNSLVVDAKRFGALVTVSAGAAGATSGNGKTVAGSVSVNRLVNTTAAYLEGATVDAVGAGTIAALDTSDIIAIGGGAAVGGATGVGFSIGFNQITGDTLASVKRSALEFGGALSLSAKNDNALRSVGISVGVGKDTGVAFTLGINLIHNTDTAEIVDSTLTGAASVTLSAQDDSVLQAIGGAVGVGMNSTGFGGALGWNSVMNTITARIERSALSGVEGDVAVTAESSEEDPLVDGKIISFAIGAAGSKDTAVGGALSINVIMNTVDAHISESSSITAGGNVFLAAADSSSIDALAFGGAASGSNAGGVAISVNVITNSISTAISGSTVASEGNVSVASQSAAIIRALAIGVSGSGSTAVSISALGNAVANNVTATIADSTVVARGHVTVAAADTAPSVIPAWMLSDEQKAKLDTALEDSPIDLDANILAVMVSVAGSGSVAVSGALSGNVVTNTIRADIAGSTVLAGVNTGGEIVNPAAGVSVTSLSDAGIIAVTVGVGASGNVAVQATGFGNVITNRVESIIEDDSIVQAGAGVELAAADESSIASVGLSVAASGTAAVSAIIGANVITNIVLAQIAASTVVSGATLDADAKTKSTIFSFTGGVAASGGAAVQVTLAGNVVANSTRALIENAGGIHRVEAGGGVTLSAEDTSSIDALAFGVAGSGGGAVGTALAANVITNTIETAIRNSTVTTGGGLGMRSESSAVIRALALGVSAGAGFAVQVSALGNAVANTVTSTISESAITAAGTVSLAACDLAPSIIPAWALSDRQQADLDAALADSPIDLDANILAVLVSVAGSGSTAINVALSGNVVTNTVATEISDSTVLAGATAGGDVINPGANVSLTSLSGAGIIAVTVGVGASGDVAISATGFGNVITNRVESLVTSSTVKAGGLVEMAATDESSIASVGLSIAASGSAAISAVIGANVITNSVVAQISGSTVSSGSALDIGAQTMSTIFSASGGVAASGAVGGQLTLAANVIANTTRAGIVEQVFKDSKGKVLSTVASAVTAGGNVSVVALDAASIDAQSGAVGIAGGAALGASSSTNLIGNTVSATVEGSTIASLGAVEVLASATSTIRAMAAGMAGSAQAAMAGSMSLNRIENLIEARASGDADIQAAGRLEIAAADSAAIDSLSGVIAIGISGAGIGGAGAYNEIANTIRARAVSATLASTGGNILVTAAGDGAIQSLAVAGGGGGLAGVAGSIAIANIGNTIEALVSDATVTAGGSILVQAVWEGQIESYGGSAAFGGFVGVGGTLVLNNLTNTVRAVLHNSQATAAGHGAGISITRWTKADNTAGWQDDRLTTSQETIHGLAVIAESRETLDNAFATVGVTAGLGLNVNKSVNLIGDVTTAGIGDAAVGRCTIEAPAVIVRAGHQSNVTNFRPPDIAPS